MNPAKPSLRSSEISRIHAERQSQVIATVLQECPDPIPQYCLNLLRHAPESFDDLRYGAVAAAAFSLHLNRRPISILTVQEELARVSSRADLTEVFNFLKLRPLPLPAGILEWECEELWHAYSFRRKATVYDEASRAIISNPTLADSIDRHARTALEVLDAESSHKNGIPNLLSEREWNPNARPAEALPVFKLKDITIGTPSNISTITAAVKSGKSAAIEAIAAATFAAEDCDTLGFESGNPGGKALLHFDSEQSPEDHWHHVDRIIRRAHADTAPKWLKSYCLTGLTFKQCQECVWEAMRIAREEYPGILAVLIDGYCDLISDVNDSAESNDFVARLHGLAIQYACHISGVIHLNPGTEKSRGHLGSQLERKAETNLQMEKNKDDESSLIFSTKNRRAGIPRKLGICFKWDDELKMHVTTTKEPCPTNSPKYHTLHALTSELFQYHPFLRYSDIHSALIEKFKVSPNTAARRFSDMIAYGMIKKSVAGLYTPTLE